MKKNKTFVTTVIISSIVGFIVLLIAMLVGIKYFVTETVPKEPQKSIANEVEDNNFYISITGVIRNLEEQSINILDIEKREIKTYQVQTTTRVQDSTEKTMPYSALKVGDIVELIYQSQKDNLVCVRISPNAFTKTDMKNLGIDRSNRTLKIGSVLYHYTGHTNIVDEEDNMINMHEVNDYDILELKGIDDQIFSVKVLAREGYIHIGKLPIYDGYLEIDRNRQIPLSEDMGTLPLVAGEHKVVLQLKGYEPLSRAITIESGKTLELDHEEFKRLQTALTIQVLNTDQDYKVKIKDKVYKKGEVITLPTDTYTVEITASGFKPYVQTLNLQEGNALMKVNLVSEEVKEEESSSDTESKKEEQDNNQANQVDYKVNISSDPKDAEIYINGEYKGITPFKGILEVGEYSIVLKKKGYKDYETNILIDQSDDQNSYLYTLIPN